MLAKIDIRKSALAFLVAAAVSTTAGIAASVHASSLAAASRQAARHLTQSGDQDTHHQSGSPGQHKLTRPANRLQGTASVVPAPR